MKKMTFPEFIEKKYLQWQNEQGKRRSIDDFAMYIGVSQPTLSMWMNGKRSPGLQTVHALAEIFGNEIYDVLGLQRPNPYKQTAMKNWEFMSEEKQAEISRMIAEEAAKYETQKKTDRVPEIQKRGKKSAG